MNVGKIKGFMVNGTTSRMRLYGTVHDVGIDLHTAKVPPAVVDAINRLKVELERAYGTLEIASPAKVDSLPKQAKALLPKA